MISVHWFRWWLRPIRHQRCPRSISPYGVTRPQRLNIIFIIIIQNFRLTCTAVMVSLKFYIWKWYYWPAKKEKKCIMYKFVEKKTSSWQDQIYCVKAIISLYLSVNVNFIISPEMWWSHRLQKIVNIIKLCIVVVYMCQVTKVRQSCYLVLLSNDTRWQDSLTFVTRSISCMTPLKYMTSYSNH